MFGYLLESEMEWKELGHNETKWNGNNWVTMKQNGMDEIMLAFYWLDICMSIIQGMMNVSCM